MDIIRNRTVLIIVLLSCFFTGFSYASTETIETHQTTYVPWSGFWWQYNKCGLGNGGGYYGHPSPLEKYELSVLGSYPRELSNWYRENYCQQEYPAWYGHCGHWAFASLWESFDILPSSIDNIVFRVGDKKGMLTLLHNNEIAAWGDGSKPEEFHLWLLKYIKDEKRGFIVDMDLGEEVWQYPVYKYTMTSQQIGSTESVHVTVVCADDNVAPDFIGTKNRYYNFYYNLFLNPEGDIIGGEWTRESVSDHPDRMYATLVPRTKSPLLDGDKVREIARSKDDPLEAGTNNVIFSPGFYNLILLDQDNYLLDTDSGSTFSLVVSLLEGGGNDMSVVLVDKNQKVILNQEITQNTPLDVSVLSDNPPYLLQLSKTSYETPGIYSILYDTFREFSNTIPYVPKDGNWSGFAITNFSEDSLKNVELTSYGKNGKPIQTLLGPLTMNPGKKMSFLFSGLPYRERQYADVDSVRISSAGDSGRLNLISGTGGGVAEIIQGRYKGPHIVMADTISEYASNSYMFARIINESASAAAVNLTLYNASGSVLKTASIELDPRESFNFVPGQSPFYNMPSGGWIDIQSQNEEVSVSGFQHIVKNKGIETNFAIPANSSNKIVPHIPLSGKWETELVLINTGNKTANMVLHRVMAGLDTRDDKRITVKPKARISVSLHDVFETSASNPYYRSILSVSSDQTFTGYYAYQALNYEDYVTIPLLDENDFAHGLVLSHNTQSKGWGTGVGIFNPGASIVKIDVKPYGNNGNFMSSLKRSITLDPGEYNVFGISGMFPSNASKIAFVRFETQKPADIIGGFHLYYNVEKGMCGSNLQLIRE